MEYFGIILLIVWIFAFDCDWFIGLIFLILWNIWGDTGDKVIEETIDGVIENQQQQVIEEKPKVNTKSLNPKETCEANDGVWVEDLKDCY